jgi:hypothetical protein
MLVVDAGADSCCNFFWVKEIDFICDTVRMYIKQKIVGIAGQQQAAASWPWRCTLISTRIV